jgi:hypothetical protein
MLSIVVNRSGSRNLDRRRSVLHRGGESRAETTDVAFYEAFPPS